MAIYVNWKGIDGSVTAKGYVNQIEVDSFGFGVGRGISMEAGNMTNRESSPPSITEISISKTMDNSTSGLFKESLTGSKGKTVEINFVRTGSDKMIKFVSYELHDVLISGYSVSANSSGEPVETLSLSFSKIVFAHEASDGSNKAGSPMRVGYDIAQGTSL